jgi:fatty-acyl-CoA synthase
MTGTLSGNLADLVEVVADAAPDRRAIATSDGRFYSYAEIDERGNRGAHLLQEMGVQRGDRVAMLAHNRLEWLDVLLGAFKVGALVANLNYRYTAHEIRHVLADCEPAVLVAEQQFAPVVAEARQDLPQRPQVLFLADVDGPPEDPAADYAARFTAAYTGRDFPPRSGDDEYLLYTGGTTGLPKGVVWTHRNLVRGALGGRWGAAEDPSASTEVLRQKLAAPPAAVMAVAPLMHGNGQWAVLRAWSGAGTAVLWTGRRYDPVGILDTIERFGVAVVIVVGDVMTVPLLEEVERTPDRWDLRSLAAFASGGAVLSPAVKATIKKTLPYVEILDGFGASEIGSIGTYSGVVAEKFPKFQIDANTTVVNQDMAEIPVGEQGLLAVTGGIATRYWRDPEKTARSFRAGPGGRRWAVLGDEAIRNGDGTVTVLGRGSLTIDSGGEKVFPDEVETVVKEHPAVSDAVVVGAADARLGEHVAAVVSLRPDAALELAELQSHVRRHLAGYKVPRTLVVVDDVPRSPAGKADYRWARGLVTAAGSRP